MSVASSGRGEGMESYDEIKTRIRGVEASNKRLTAENEKLKAQIEEIRFDCIRTIGAEMIDGKFQDGIKYQANHTLGLFNGEIDSDASASSQ